jgi:mannan polymerase II complex MNN11 subunit
MHLAYPTRKNSDPPIFRSRHSRPPLIRRIRFRRLAAVGAGIFLLLFLIRSLLFGSGRSREKRWKPAGTPPVVIVTVLQPGLFGKEYIESVRENRLKYSERHGYETFFARPDDYDISDAPDSWARIAAMRHALTTFPECRYVWFLDQDAYIMDPSLSLEERLLDSKKLESLMIRDYPVVPPDSIVVRNGDWAKFFLDTWFDPLYRSYNFQKAESHALEHIVQWHPTVLKKLALVPQRVICSYGNGASGEPYLDGDFVVRFPDCGANPGRPGQERCEAVAAPFVPQWRAAFGLGQSAAEGEIDHGV